MDIEAEITKLNAEIVADYERHRALLAQADQARNEARRKAAEVASLVRRRTPIAVILMEAEQGLY